MSKKKVMIGMSGGVDSSVAAALLLRQGFEVIGVTMQIWPDCKDADAGSCCSLSAVDDARRVANKLGIPYYVLNFKDIFEKEVITYFKSEYLKGKTPNPCIACNKYVKFEHLLNKACAMGIDYIATGHYANIEYDDVRKRFILKKSVNTKKDQTYVLYNMTQFQLSNTILPIGNFNKDEIRKIAEDIDLEVASKPDSQEICFVQNNDYASFIKKNSDVDIKEGNFIDINGNAIGRHNGIIHYTIGQRKGLGIAFGKPMYVVDINAIDNTVVLGEHKDIYRNSLIANNVNLISIDKLGEPLRVKAKIRYSAKEENATIYPLESNKINVVFDDPQRAITPGQAVVFYDGDIVVGGGTIEETY